MFGQDRHSDALVFWIESKRQVHCHRCFAREVFRNETLCFFISQSIKKYKHYKGFSAICGGFFTRF